jgi:hypothetical protein
VRDAMCFVSALPHNNLNGFAMLQAVEHANNITYGEIRKSNATNQR